MTALPQNDSDMYRAMVLDERERSDRLQQQLQAARAFVHGEISEEEWERARDEYMPDYSQIIRTFALMGMHVDEQPRKRPWWRFWR